MLIGGVLQWLKFLKRAEECPCNRQQRGRGLSGEEGETRGWGNFNDDNSLKISEKCPYSPKQILSMIAWSPLFW